MEFQLTKTIDFVLFKREKDREKIDTECLIEKKGKKTEITCTNSFRRYLMNSFKSQEIGSTYLYQKNKNVQNQCNNCVL